MDAQITEIVVVLAKAYENRMNDAVAQLKAIGMQVSNADDDNSVVEGCIDSAKLHDLKALDCVNYIRTVFTYDANYPPGDPRDVDGRLHSPVFIAFTSVRVTMSSCATD